MTTSTVIEFSTSTISSLSRIVDNDTLFITFLKDASGAFLGALFAFIFFIIQEKLMRRYHKKKEWVETYKKEHAILERYLYVLHDTINSNKNAIEIIVNSYQKKQIDLNKLVKLPIYEDASMRVDDILFINKLETYINNGLRRINRYQNAINTVQDKLNEHLLDGDGKKQYIAESSLSGFIVEAEKMIKSYNYYLDVVNDLIIENRLLLKKYKKWNYKKNKTQEQYDKRKEEIKAEKINSKTEILNPLVKEQKEKLKKYDLDVDKLE